MLERILLYLTAFIAARAAAGRGEYRGYAKAQY
jgi:hypothetical protein